MSPVLVDGAFPIVDGTVTAFDRIGVVTLAAVLLPYAEPVLQLAARLRALAAPLMSSREAPRPRDRRRRQGAQSTTLNLQPLVAACELGAGK